MESSGKRVISVTWRVFTNGWGKMGKRRPCLPGPKNFIQNTGKSRFSAPVFAFEQENTIMLPIPRSPLETFCILSNDAGSAWIMPGLTPRVAGTVSNSQCTLNAGSSSVSTPGVTGGPIYYNELGLNVALTFNSTFTGLKNVYFYAAGYSGLNSGWVNDGTWTP
jgi:hypothetical protein